MAVNDVPNEMSPPRTVVVTNKSMHRENSVVWAAMKSTSGRQIFMENTLTDRVRVRAFVAKVARA